MNHDIYLYKNITLLAQSQLAATIDGDQLKAAVYAVGIDSSTVIEGFRIKTNFIVSILTTT